MSRNWRFGRFKVLVDQRILLDSGRALPVGGRAFDLLLALLTNRSRVITKSELLDLVWPQQDVEESNLNVQISNLRKILGASAIVTVAGRGYQFVLPAEQLEPELDTSPITVEAAPVPPLWSPLSKRAAPQLPVNNGGMIGRTAEAAELHQLLDEQRLISVVGAGGIGKTTLALAVLHERQAAAPHPVLWMELAQLSDAENLNSTLAAALGVPLSQHGVALPGLLSTLRDVDLLLVFDSAEHLGDAVARLAKSLLTGTRGVRILLTSQCELRLADEQVLRLNPLSLPDYGDTPEAALDSDAVALFVNRVQHFNHDFRLDAKNVGSVINICRQLDGVALAIELAAARVPLLGLRGLQQRLGERFNLLTQGSPASPIRQQTLRAALDWSYGLLTVQQQFLFRLLGVFKGGFTLDLVTEQVRSLQGSTEIMEDWEVIDCLEMLIHRSLVGVMSNASEDDMGTVRYRLLESAREYALLRLRIDDELNSVRRAHAVAVCKVMSEARDRYWLAAQAEWVRAYEPELENVRSAMDWAVETEPALAVRLAGMAMPLFNALSLGVELRRRSHALLQDVDRVGVTAEEAAWFVLVCSQQTQSESKELQHRLAMDAAARFRACGHAIGLYLALYEITACFLAHPHDAVLAAQEMMTLEASDWPAALRGLGRLGRSKACYGVADMAGNRAALEEALVCLQGTGADDLMVIVLTNLADHDLFMDRVDEAIDRGYALSRLLKDSRQRWSLVFAQCNLAGALLRANRVAEARTHLTEALAAMQAMNWTWLSSFGDVYALFAALEGRHEDAARLAGWADHMARERGPREPNEERYRELIETVSPAMLGAERFAMIRDSGRLLTDEQVAQLTLRLP